MSDGMAGWEEEVSCALIYMFIAPRLGRGKDAFGGHFQLPTATCPQQHFPAAQQADAQNWTHVSQASCA